MVNSPSQGAAKDRAKECLPAHLGGRVVELQLELQWMGKE